MSCDTTFGVTITLDAGSRRPPLLAISSVLHRRHVAVLDAELCRSTGSRQAFSATVVTDTRRMNTLARSLLRDVDVLGVDYVELRESPDAAVAPPAT